MWINQYKQGIPIEQIMKITIDDMIKNEEVRIWLFKQKFDKIFVEMLYGRFPKIKKFFSEKNLKSLNQKKHP